MGRGDADDLIALLRTIEATTELATALTAENQLLEKASPASEEKLACLALGSLRGRLSLDRPEALASSIAAAIDEDGLMQSHRVEESDSADMVTLAQDVLKSEGTAEDLDALSGVVRSKAGSKATLDHDTEEAETWIMRRT